MTENYIERLRKYESYLMREGRLRPFPIEIIYQQARDELRRRFPEISKRDNEELLDRVYQAIKPE